MKTRFFLAALRRPSEEYRSGSSGPFKQGKGVSLVLHLILRSHNVMTGNDDAGRVWSCMDNVLTLMAKGASADK